MRNYLFSLGNVLSAVSLFICGVSDIRNIFYKKKIFKKDNEWWNPFYYKNNMKKKNKEKKKKKQKNESPAPRGVCLRRIRYI